MPTRAYIICNVVYTESHNIKVIIDFFNYFEYTPTEYYDDGKDFTGFSGGTLFLLKYDIVRS